MDFEIGHLDMDHTEFDSRSPISNSHSHSTSQIQSQSQPHPIAAQSIILNELQKETEELQNKLKLNSRRLLLFEAENNKLLEEKNKLFFETRNVLERNKILLEKNASLESENEHFEERLAHLQEKIQSFEQINKTQLTEIKRYSKFHLKIQNVIKPYLQQLKTQVQSLTEDLLSSRKTNEQLQHQNADLGKRLALQQDHYLGQIAALEHDKVKTTASYEEQIHSFSKEILHLEQKNDELLNEVGRLKKSVEFKNYFENELIKFKRIHEDDQRQIVELKEKVSWLTVSLTEKEQLACSAQDRQRSAEASSQSLEQLLETTRTQLAKQIDHSNALSERLARLEKLNLNLSQQMRPMP